MKLKHEYKDIDIKPQRFRIGKFGISARFQDSLNMGLKLELFSTRIDGTGDKKQGRGPRTSAVKHADNEASLPALTINHQHLKGHARCHSDNAIIFTLGIGHSLHQEAPIVHEEVEKPKLRKYDRKFIQLSTELAESTNSRLSLKPKKPKDKAAIENFVTRDKSKSV
jgi:hypothetical protein